MNAVHCLGFVVSCTQQFVCPTCSIIISKVCFSAQSYANYVTMHKGRL